MTDQHSEITDNELVDEELLNEIKKNVEVKQDDNGKNLFTKKGAEIPFSFKDGSETVILKTDGSNVSRYIRTILAEEDILIVKNIQPIAPPTADSAS